MSSVNHPLLHTAKKLTQAQSQFPVTALTLFIGCSTDGAGYIIMGALTFMIKSLSCVFLTAGPPPVWQQGNSLQTSVSSTGYDKTFDATMLWYLHFSGNESRQLRQEQEEYEDTAENGNCGQRGKVEWITCSNPKPYRTSLTFHSDYTKVSRNDETQMSQRNSWAKVLTLMKSPRP